MGPAVEGQPLAGSVAVAGVPEFFVVTGVAVTGVVEGVVVDGVVVDVVMGLGLSVGETTNSMVVIDIAAGEPLIVVSTINGGSRVVVIVVILSLGFAYFYSNRCFKTLQM